MKRWIHAVTEVEATDECMRRVKLLATNKLSDYQYSCIEDLIADLLEINNDSEYELIIHPSSFNYSWKKLGMNILLSPASKATEYCDDAYDAINKVIQKVQPNYPDIKIIFTPLSKISTDIIAWIHVRCR